MRATAAEDGVEFDPAPPYRVQRTATFTPEQLRDTLTEAEARLGRRLDEWPRPHLCDGGLDGFAPQLPGPQHAAIWFSGRDLFGRRRELLSSVRRRLDLDPYATLDVVLAPADPFPLDLLDALRATFAAAQQSYTSRALAHRGEDLQRRIAIVLRDDFDPSWIDAAREVAQVFREQPIRSALRDARRLGDDLPGARIVGEVSPEDFAALGKTADADFVCFEGRDLEAAWQRSILGFADPR